MPSSEDLLPDRPPDPAEGEPASYALPSAYGPALTPPRFDELDHDDLPAVTLHDRDAEVVTSASNGSTVVGSGAGVATAAASGAGGPDAGAAAGPPLSRRELREQRERSRSKERTSVPKKTRSKRSKWIRRGVAVVVVLALIPVVIDYANYLNKPGSDSMSVRTVEWVRDNGGNGIVNTIERWWYTNNPPPTGGRPSAIKVQDTVAETGKPTATTAAPQVLRLAPPTLRVPTPATQVEPNEGVWQPTGRLVLGQPAVYTTYVRPDALHTSYYTGVMWLDTKLLKSVYVVGLEQPGGNGPNPWGSQIPGDQRENAIAAFNSGFKMDSANGGAYLQGQTMVPLRDGAASFVIKQDGSASVGQWGRDFILTPDVQAVRQNLVLIVDNGQLNPLLRENDTTDFGATLGNNVYVWRSGVGVTADGALVYAGGPAMSIIALARTLQAAGAVRAMEMDINTDWVSAFTYQPNTTVAGNPIEGVKLLDNMTHDGSQYLQPNSRDFFAFMADGKYVPTAPTTTTTTHK
jgi:hypothetical protein